jgi:cystathionine gamma-synthase
MSRHVETTLVTGSRPEGPGSALNVPLVPAATYRAGGELNYGRNGNVSWTAFEELLGELEGGTCVTYSSGLAASAAALALVPAGGIIAAQASAYFGVTEQIRARAADGTLTARWFHTAEELAAVSAGADMVWLESPSNPLITVWDIAAAVTGAALLVVDSTFATPLLQQPIALGADVVLHSATKYIGGHADLLLGALVAAEPAVADRLRSDRYIQGAVPGALEVFLALRGARTLAVRLERAQASAQVLAERLAEHPGVSTVRYPGLPSHPEHELAAKQMSGFGAMLSFETVGTAADCDAFIDRLEVITAATSLGGVESLIERRCRYPAEVAAGTPETLVRFSVGIEHVEDLWADLDRALRG